MTTQDNRTGYEDYQDLPDYLELTEADWWKITDHYHVPFHIVADFIRLRSEPAYRLKFEQIWRQPANVDCFEDWAAQASNLDWLSDAEKDEIAEQLLSPTIGDLTPGEAWADLGIRDQYLALMRLLDQLADWANDGEADEVIDREEMEVYYGEYWDMPGITDRDLENAARCDDRMMNRVLEAAWANFVEPNSRIMWKTPGLQRHILHILHLS